MNTHVSNASLGTQGTALVDDDCDLHLELSKAADKAQKQDDRAMLNAGYGQTIGGLALTQACHARVTAAIEVALGAKKRQQSHSKAFQLERFMRQLEPSVVALSLLQSALHCVCRKDKKTHRDVCLMIGGALNDELYAHKLLQTDKRLSRKVNKAAKERFGAVELRKAAVKRLAEQAGFSMEDWGNRLIAFAGQWGLNVLLEACPDVFMLSEPEGHWGERKLLITEGGLETAKDAIAEAVCKSPVYQPRTVRPKGWTGFVMNVAEDDRTMARAQILRTGHKDVISAARYAIGRGHMAPALEAINAMQSTAWKINAWLVDVVEQCHARGIQVEGLPSKNKLEVPPRLPQAEFNAMSVERRTLYAKTRNGMAKENRANDSDNLLLKEDLEIAKRLAPCDRFYTPMSMDWRGRVYALTHFNFQRSDRVRAMFLFADGEPIGERGLYWLKIHVANSGAFDKVDKKPFEERIKWVDDNIDLIRDYVKRPLYNTGWVKADSPFLFLAACFELVAAIASGSPEAYVCHLPVSFDGSCNGLQHLCAMTRSEEGYLVNLGDNAEPQDVYQVVADIVRKSVEADLGNHELFGKRDDDKPERKTIATLHHLATLALPHVDRKLCKRNVMVFAYSSKEYGMAEQHMEDTMAPLETRLLRGEIASHPFGDGRDEWQLMSRYLAKRTLAAIKQVVSMPAEAMGFMQTIAKAAAHEGKPVKWTSPAGIPCINKYHDAVTDRIELWCYDKGVKDTIRTEIKLAVDFGADVNKEKAASAIAPNFVHSMDAAALLLTVQACVSEGITSIATVHDSFGCLPSQADRFNAIIREQFLKMYTDHDVLAELLESARNDLTPANHHRLPELPAKGGLDLTEIINAKYAFA